MCRSKYKFNLSTFKKLTLQPEIWWNETQNWLNLFSLSFLQVNFTEAAMFLQGTASVYSKKVEFLWQSVLKMIDLLASKKALDEVDAPGETCLRFFKDQIDIYNKCKIRILDTQSCPVFNQLEIMHVSEIQTENPVFWY